MNTSQIPEICYPNIVDFKSNFRNVIHQACYKVDMDKEPRKACNYFYKMGLRKCL